MNDRTFAGFRDALTHLGEELQSRTQDGIRVTEVLENLRRNRFDVAVIGQIKAGKSTFLNALIQRPTLLPTDVNPWTAVIARMHFGDPDGRQDGARFQFFTREEWEQVTEGAGRMGRARARISSIIHHFTGAEPNDDADDDFKKQQQEVVRRARKRLGRELDNWLGRSMELPTVQRSELEPFLCCGDEDGNGNPEMGRYSDITREGELWFGQKPFDEYLTLVDTPGTNDPFGMRSRLTEDYIANAQAFVVIMNATQAMTSSDMATLDALIKNLSKHRVIVFVNQIDRLNDPERDTPRVVMRVRQTLEKTFPNVSIPVIPGCAYWMEQALAMQDPRAFMNREGWKLLPYAVSTGMLSQADADRFRDFGIESMAELEHLVTGVSGMDKVRAAIAGTLLREKGVGVLSDAKSSLLRFAERMAAEAGQQAAASEQMIRQFETDLETLAQKEQELADEKADFEENKADLRASTAMIDQLDETIAEFSQDTRLRMESMVSRFAASQEGHFRTVGIKLFGPRVWATSLDDLRSELALAFRDRYQGLLTRLERDKASILRTIRASRMGDQTRDAINEALSEAFPVIDPEPSLPELNRTVSVDLGGWLERLLSGREDDAEKAAALRQEIEEAFTEPIDDLVERINNVCCAQVAQYKTRLGRSVDDAIERLQQGFDRQLQQHQSLLQQEAPETKAQRIAEMKEQIEVLQREQADLLDLAARIQALPVRQDPDPGIGDTGTVTYPPSTEIQ